MSAVPSADQRYSFETDGYLVLESFLSPDHVARLRAALQQTIAGRRELERRGPTSAACSTRVSRTSTPPTPSARRERALLPRAGTSTAPTTDSATCVRGCRCWS